MSQPIVWGAITGIVAAGLLYAIMTTKRIEAVERLAQQAITTRGVEPPVVSRRAWPGLGQEKTIALGEALKLRAKVTVTIFCGTPDCRLLATDIDDAMQIADWPSDIESAQALGSTEPGIIVGPPGAPANILAAELRKAIGDVVTVTAIACGKTECTAKQVGILIGKRP